jgi:hypothetical protein
VTPTKAFTESVLLLFSIYTSADIRADPITRIRTLSHIQIRSVESFLIEVVVHYFHDLIEESTVSDMIVKVKSGFHFNNYE